MTHDQESKKNENPGWFDRDPEFHNVAKQRKNRAPRVLERRDVLSDDGRSSQRGGRGLRTGHLATERESRRSDRESDPERSRTLEGVSWITGETQGKVKIKLGDLRDAISDQYLRQLLEGTYDKDKCLTIRTTHTLQSSFAEDCFFTSTKKVKRIKQKVTLIPPSKRYETEWEAFLRKEKEADVKVILAYYFKQYLRYFKEEDPEWTGKKLLSAEITVSKMISETEASPIEIMKYVKGIMPRWYARLLAGEDFPSSRPTLNSLFRSKHFWANRKVYLSRWAMP